jgi:hypothetical protein
VDVGSTDNDETEFLCLLLDAARVPSPLVDVGWADAWAEQLVSAADVTEAAKGIEAREE